MVSSRGLVTTVVRDGSQWSAVGGTTVVVHSGVVVYSSISGKSLTLKLFN